ncbi:hypothetical protein AQUCO_01600187v1 [Aquilegia coerulea]|uniref:MATH domain-containing protein n=1 Tax=Aquilegia coerulea TaxID=218851 RepID=A0A2G5DQG8_AQUCA|nr:hypothetical protein AQUCO_01600187v1 [Aquilegia coerulea]
MMTAIACKKAGLNFAGNTRSSVRFEAQMRSTWASPPLMLAILTNQSNGYLVGDECMFGVEVLVCDNTCQRDCISIMKGGVAGKFCWKIRHVKEKFLGLQKKAGGSSPLFKVGNFKW